MKRLMPYSNDPFMDLARVGYAAYATRCDPPVTPWDELHDGIRLKWRASAKAMKLHVDDHGWPALPDENPSEETRRKMAARP